MSRDIFLSVTITPNRVDWLIGSQNDGNVRSSFDPSGMTEAQAIARAQRDALAAFADPRGLTLPTSINIERRDA